MREYLKSDEPLLSIYTKEEIIDLLPGRHFAWKNKKYECATIKITPDNKKFIINTYTNPVVIPCIDIDEITLLPVVVIIPTAQKRKTPVSGKERNPRIKYDYILLVKLINKPEANSWLEYSAILGYPDSSSSLYQKFLSIVKSADDADMSLNAYVDSLKPMLDIHSKNRIKYNKIEPQIKQQEISKNNNDIEVVVEKIDLGKIDLEKIDLGNVEKSISEVKFSNEIKPLYPTIDKKIDSNGINGVEKSISEINSIKIPNVGTSFKPNPNNQLFKSSLTLSRDNLINTLENERTELLSALKNLDNLINFYKK